MGVVQAQIVPIALFALGCVYTEGIVSVTDPSDPTLAVASPDRFAVASLAVKSMSAVGAPQSPVRVWPVGIFGLTQLVVSLTI